MAERLAGRRPLQRPGAAAVGRTRARRPCRSPTGASAPAQAICWLCRAPGGRRLHVDGQPAPRGAAVARCRARTARRPGCPSRRRRRAGGRCSATPVSTAMPSCRRSRHVRPPSLRRPDPVQRDEPRRAGRRRSRRRRAWRRRTGAAPRSRRRRRAQDGGGAGLAGSAQSVAEHPGVVRVGGRHGDRLRAAPSRGPSTSRRRRSLDEHGPGIRDEPAGHSRRGRSTSTPRCGRKNARRVHEAPPSEVTSTAPTSPTAQACTPAAAPVARRTGSPAAPGRRRRRRGRR